MRNHVEPPELRPKHHAPSVLHVRCICLSARRPEGSHPAEQTVGFGRPQLGKPQMKEEGQELCNPSLLSRPAQFVQEKHIVGYSLRFPHDQENLERQFEVYDALYAWCCLQVASGS